MPIPYRALGLLLAAATLAAPASTAVGSADVTQPRLTKRFPGINQVKIAPSANASVTFNEPVVNVDDTTFLVLPSGGTPVAATVTRVGSTNEYVLDPVADLLPDTPHEVVLVGRFQRPGGIQDLAGNPLPGQNWGFLTGPAPKITERTPAPRATRVAPTADVDIAFSEPVHGVSASTFRLERASDGADIGGAVSQDGERAWSLDPAAPLAEDTAYRVTLTGGGTAIRDAAGNPLATTSWTFVTGPAPVVLTRTPAPGATGVPRSSAVRVRFDEEVTGVTGATFRLRNTRTGVTLAATVAYDGSAGEWVLTPAAPMAAATRHTVSLTGSPTAIRDLAGNPLATTSWNFTTGP